MKFTIGSPPGSYLKRRKIFLVMNLTAIILLSATLTVSAKGYAQKITLNLKDAPLKTVFVKINKQTGFNFLYSDEDLAKTKEVTLDVKDASLEKVLELCFKDQPLNYSISNNTIVIKENTTTGEIQPPVAQPPIDISGRITDKEGKPLEGASVIVKGTKAGTMTDANGFFVLKNVTVDNEIIITYTGYKSETLKIGNRRVFNLSLELSNDPLIPCYKLQ